MLDCPITQEGETSMPSRISRFFDHASKMISASLAIAVATASSLCAQSVPVNAAPKKTAVAATKRSSLKPKLVVVLVVDQMRADYIDKFQHQWTGGLKRLIDEGAWFREAAYPYAGTETCPGHSTISTGAFPATHGMIANEWWDREQQKDVTCTADANAKNIAYAGGKTSGGDGVAKMLVPSFADELKFQSGSGTRIVTMSLKARASITLAGHQGDAVTWFDGTTGAWLTSSIYPQAPFVEEFVKSHPATADFGKTWSPLLPDSEYLYERIADGAGSPSGYGASFPHPLRGEDGNKGPDASFYRQWGTSPYAETYLEQMAEAAVNKLSLGQGSAIDFLGISFSSVDYVGHSFGPRSWEVQDELARLDRDLAAFFSLLDKKVGRENFVVAFTADHGVAPIPEELRKTGIDAGRLNLNEVKTRVDTALEPFHVSKPAVADISGSDVYFKPETLAKLKSDPSALQAVIDAMQTTPGVVHVYTAEELQDRQPTKNPLRSAEAAGFLKSRSGDLLIVPKPYWIWDSSMPGKPSRGGTSHGTPYFYDQRVPVILMGAGIRPGKYYEGATPADIAPTLAVLCGITLSTRDSRVLQEAIASPSSKSTSPTASSLRTKSRIR